jgi:hypothetical protein
MSDLSSILPLSVLEQLSQNFDSMWNHEGVLSFFPWIFLSAWTVTSILAPRLFDVFFPKLPELHETDPEILNFRLKWPEKPSHSSLEKVSLPKEERKSLELGRFRIEELPPGYLKSPHPTKVRRCFQMSYLTNENGPNEFRDELSFWLDCDLGEQVDLRSVLDTFMKVEEEGDFNFWYLDPEYQDAHVTKRGEDDYEVRLVAKGADFGSFTYTLRRLVKNQTAQCAP